jgi:hypothetical protein
MLQELAGQDPISAVAEPEGQDSINPEPARLPYEIPEEPPLNPPEGVELPTAQPETPLAASSMAGLGAMLESVIAGEENIDLAQADVGDESTDISDVPEEVKELDALARSLARDSYAAQLKPPADSEVEEVQPPLPPEEGSVVLEGVSLADAPGLEDLPEEAQQELVRRVRIEALDTDEEVADFAVGLVLAGSALIMPQIADATCARAARGQVVFTMGSLKAGIPLRAVAAEDGTRVAVWGQEVLDEVTADCPWVADELRQVGDRYQALAGVTMGVMGERLDEALRSLVTTRCEVKRLLPNEILLKQGEKVGGLYIVGAGRIELCESEDDVDVLDELGPGDFLFAPQVLTAGTAPSIARACRQGTLILFADRMTAHELMLSVPPLLEILSG